MKKLFSFEGRAARQEFWLTMLGGLIACTIVQGIAVEVPAFMFVMIPVYWIMFAVSARRLHAIDMCGWWQLVPFLSFVTGFMSCKEDKDVQDKYKGE